MYEKLSKCDFYRDRIQYLGHIISKEGISMDPENIEAIMNWHTPRNVTDIRSFMGLAGYYRRFIEGFSKVAHAITSLQKKGIKFEWNSKCEKNLPVVEESSHQCTDIEVCRSRETFYGVYRCMWTRAWRIPYVG